MKKFKVLRPELHYSEVEVNADTPQEALSIVKEMGGEETDYFEYSHTLETGWIVQNENGMTLIEDLK